MPVSAAAISVVYNAGTGLFDRSEDTTFLADGTRLLSTNGAPTNAVQGTGYGTAENSALYVKTAGKVLYKNSRDASFPTWALAGGTDRSGAGAPTNGVTAGDTGDYYSNTTAYGIDPTTGWYICTNGATDTWAAVGVTVLSGAAVPTNAVLGTGAGVADVGTLCVDYANNDLYISGGTAAHPTWSAT